MGITDWLLKPLGWLFARHPDWRDAFGRLLLRIGRGYYWVLAVIFAAAGAWNLLGHPFDNELAQQSFDLLMRQRPVAYPADPNVVVLDIDEPSLAAMRSIYGRWPWPREVLAKVAAKIESEGASAVVFDILFADEDVANPASEAEFSRYVGSSEKSFFPAVRLNPLNDANSQVTLGMLKFAERDPAIPAARIHDGQTIAMMTPYFRSIYDSARVGTNNIDADPDNVVRWYTSYNLVGGYRIPSLPYRVAQQLHWPLPQRPANLINWPKGITPYRTIGFARALDAVKANDEAFFTQLSGKVVVIGSTAPDLNDIKATPIDSKYPGIYILATVIDNIKNQRFLRPLSPALIWVLEVLMLIASVELFTRTNQALTVAKYFFIVPGVLLGISLLSVSLSDMLIDLSVPAAVVLGYFTFAKLFDSNVRSFIAGTGPFTANKTESVGKLQIACLPATVPRERVIDLLKTRGLPIKLWEPEAAGLGKFWSGQGWVLWRWLAAGETDSAQVQPQAQPLPLCWFDAPSNQATAGTFALAQSIVMAASNSTREDQ
jgi:adenylate cyclase